MPPAAATRELPPAADGSDLRQLAHAARQALRADAVAVTTRSSSGRSAIAELAGARPERHAAIARAIERLDAELGDTGLEQLDDLHVDPRAGARAIAAEGFAVATCAAMELDATPVGRLHVLHAEPPGEAPDEGLVLAFARHCAIGADHRRLRRRAASLAERLEILGALDQLALSTSDFEELTTALDRALEAVLGRVRTGIMVWDEPRDLLQMLPGSFGASEATAASYQISVREAHSNAARVFATGRPYLSNHATGDPAILQDYVEAFGISRLLSVQLVMGDRPVGVLHVAGDARPFDVDDLQRVESLAPRIATAVELAGTLFRLRRQQRLETSLAEVAVAIASGQGVQDFLPRAFDDLASAVEADLVVLTPIESSPIRGRTPRRAKGLTRRLVAEAQAQPPLRADVRQPEGAGDPGSAALHVPVDLGKQRIGTLSALRMRGEPFSPDERSALSRLANLAALAWATERYQQQRAELARIHERQRIADDLHDDVAQILFGAQMRLDAALDAVPADAPAAAEVVAARALLLRGDGAIRDVIHQLSRPPALDLPSRLMAIVEQVELDFSIPIHAELDAPAVALAPAVSRPVADVLVRVAREALVNAGKHAGPCRAILRLRARTRSRLVLTVIDDGLGRAVEDPERPSHGLAALRRMVREQGGTLRIQSEPSSGTLVCASVPI